MKHAPHSRFSEEQLHLRVLPGDILLVAGRSWVSRRIMKATRDPETKEPAPISHVGLVTSGGTIRTAMVTEAAGGSVRQSRIGDVYREGQGLAIMRPLNIPGKELDAIVRNMVAQVGERYGYGDIALFGLGTIPGLRWLERFVTDDRPVCSVALDRAMQPLGYSFGVDRPTPAHVWRFGMAYAWRYAWPFGRGELHSIPPAEPT